MPDLDLLRKTVKSIVEMRLAPAKILDVTVVKEWDHDGDPVLRIGIIFESEDGRPDTQKVLGLARHLRNPLEKMEEEGFPVFTFMTPEERASEAA